MSELPVLHDEFSESIQPEALNDQTKGRHHSDYAEIARSEQSGEHHRRNQLHNNRGTLTENRNACAPDRNPAQTALLGYWVKLTFRVKWSQNSSFGNVIKQYVHAGPLARFPE